MVEYSNNIIKFPKENKRHVLNVDNTSIEQIDENIIDLKNYVINEILSIVIPALQNQLEIIGYPIDNEYAKDGAFISEAIRSMLLKYYEIDHPIQELAESMFEFDENDDLTLSGKLSIITNPNAVAIGNN